MNPAGNFGNKRGFTPRNRRGRRPNPRRHRSWRPRRNRGNNNAKWWAAAFVVVAFLAVGLLILSQTANPSGDSSADFRGQTFSQVMPGERETSSASATSTTDDSARHQTHDRTIAFIEDIAAENIHLLTNIARSENGVLSRLGGSDDVRRIAKAHSAAMLEAGQLNHVLNGKGPTDRAMDAGYDCEVHMGDGVYEYGLSENIAFLSGYSGLSGREDAQMLARKFMERWRNSPEHWGNILDRDAKYLGVGVKGDGDTWYATQNFAVC